MLDQIAAKLVEKGLVTAQWESDVMTQGALVKLFREYYDGFHRIQLTPEMKKMVGISDDRLDRFNCNYCEMVVGTMADRLTVEQFDVSGAVASDNKASDPTQMWVKDLVDANRFDALQIAVREAVLRDGETFIMSQYDDALGRVRWAHEPAFDGEVGTIAIYQRGYDIIAAAVKIWFDVPPTPAEVMEGESGDTSYVRVNIYYPDYTEKYYSKAGKTLTLVDEPEETTKTKTVRQGKAMGVPVVCFSNKGGVSELVNIIPLQDSLNSFVIDLVMAGKLTAFSIFFGVNVNVPQGLTPGMTILKNLVDSAGATIIPQSLEEAQRAAAYLSASKLERLQGGDLKQILDAINMVVNQIAVISSTPIPNQTSGTVTASGEALIQRDRRLQGKLERAQVQIGNRWEDVILLSQKQQTLDGHKFAPEITEINTRWKTSEMRSGADILLAAKQLNDWGFTRQALKTLSQSNLVSYTDAEIEVMMNERNADARKNLFNAINQNDMSNLNVPTNQPRGAANAQPVASAAS